jgi:hypothetical protein
MDTTKGNEPPTIVGGDYPQGEFHCRLLACWQGIDALVFGLAERYDFVVILRALAEHTGTGLQLLYNADRRRTAGAASHQSHRKQRVPEQKHGATS